MTTDHPHRQRRRRFRREVEPRTHLGDFLRDQPRLTGTHLGCEHGVCGACTVLIDGAAGALLHRLRGRPATG